MSSQNICLGKVKYSIIAKTFFMSANALDSFFTALQESISQKQFVKLTLSDRRYKTNELKNVFIKPVLLKAGYMLSFVYRYPTKDVTKNYDIQEALQILGHMLQKDFFKADLFTVSTEYHLTITRNEKALLTQKQNIERDAPPLVHNKEKKRYILAENNVYLKALGITTHNGIVKSDKQDKFRQINKYVEVVDSVIKEANLSPVFKVADMGSGKGYLTFALYDYLQNVLHLKPQIKGVEIRNELVDQCNRIAAEAGFTELHFNAGSIENSQLSSTDMLIALHACDVATDQAISQGIKANAKVIICAPCCHKQVRKQIHPLNELKAITRYGILEERQAEILTDTIRALIMEAYGYKTKVFEFISTEHTPKNVMIAGVKTTNETTPRPEVLEQIKQLKALFNLEYHELERLMAC